MWFKLDGNNQNLVKVGDELIVKVDTAGPVLTEEKTTVLAVTAFPSKGITAKSLKGLYMLLKPSGWTIDSTQQNYFRGTKIKTQPVQVLPMGVLIIIVLMRTLLIITLLIPYPLVLLYE